MSPLFSSISGFWCERNGKKAPPGTPHRGGIRNKSDHHYGNEAFADNNCGSWDGQDLFIVSNEMAGKYKGPLQNKNKLLASI